MTTNFRHSGQSNKLKAKFVGLYCMAEVLPNYAYKSSFKTNIV